MVGLDSTRPYRHQSGALREAQLRQAAERLGEAADGAYRVVVFHHRLLGSPRLEKTALKKAKTTRFNWIG